MARRDDVDIAVQEWMDVDGALIAPDLLQDACDELCDLLPEGDPWGEEEYRILGEHLTAARDLTHARAEEVRRACQRRGEATIGQIRVRINTEFWDRSKPNPALDGWPTSEHWWVELEAPDGRFATYTRDDLSGWDELLLEAGEAEEQWQCRVQEIARSQRQAMRKARGHITAAEHALAQAVAERDELIRSLLAEGLAVSEVQSGLGLSRARVYQIKDGNPGPGDADR